METVANFIHGECVTGSGQRVQAIFNPATGEPLAEVARGAKRDVDAAVASARAVFERGDWSQAAPAARKAVLMRLAALMEQHHEELALLESLEG